MYIKIRKTTTTYKQQVIYVWLSVIFEPSDNSKKNSGVTSLLKKWSIHPQIVSFSSSDHERAIHGFISSSLDKSHVLYAGVHQFLLAHLQLIQNAAACLLANTHRCENITSVLFSSYWLPVSYWFETSFVCFQWAV